MVSHAQNRRARLILVVAALAYVALFWVNTSGRVRCRAAVKTEELCQNGAGVVVWNDGHGYYAWLRSALIDGDLHFENEFTDLNPWGRQYFPRGMGTPTGHYPNFWSVGPACAWALPVLACHGAVASGAAGAWPADGYSLPYQLTVAGTTLALGLGTLVLLFGICRHFAEPVTAACAAACVGLGTTLVYYATVEPSMGHGPAAACFALFCWYWLRGFGETSARRWFVLGLLLGVSALMRWQLASYALLPAGEWLWLLRRDRADRPTAPRAAALVALALAGGLLGLAPQLAAWKVVYGGWFAQPIGLERNWLAPDLWNVLCSTDRSFFYWTPITLLSALGLVLALRRSGQRPQLALLLVGFAVQVYALAAIRGGANVGVCLGAAFGHRTLTESCVVLAPGLALLLGARRWVLPLALALVGWNLLLIGAYRFWVLPAEGGGTPVELWAAVTGYAHRRATDALLLAILPVLALALLGRSVPADAAPERRPRPAVLARIRARLLRRALG